MVHSCAIVRLTQVSGKLTAPTHLCTRWACVHPCFTNTSYSTPFGKGKPHSNNHTSADHMMVPIQLERKTSFLKVGLKKSCCFYTSTKEIKKKPNARKISFMPAFPSWFFSSWRQSSSGCWTVKARFYVGGRVSSIAVNERSSHLCDLTSEDGRLLCLISIWRGWLVYSHWDYCAIAQFAQPVWFDKIGRIGGDHARKWFGISNEETGKVLVSLVAFIGSDPWCIITV